jgi:myo-inositol-1(or 4)-monophosphatase
MSRRLPAHGPDWLGASRRATVALSEILRAAPTTAERAWETGTTGEGGDRTLRIDAAAEAAVFAELEHLHAEGARFTAISEERGTVDYDGSGTVVVIDPIDGSLNAKRRISHYSLSLAVADGPTMADVHFAYVFDFGPGEEWTAHRGGGATLDGVPLSLEPGERRDAGGLLEVVGLESADPRWVVEAAQRLGQVAYRVRALGTIAVTLCQVAGARFDGMTTLKGCRSVDAAAGQLIVREAGGLVALPTFATDMGRAAPADWAARSLAAAPLDLVGHSALVAARTPAGLSELAGVAPLPSWRP